MKKRKIYEISVIDKTYSKTISDETKFYTSDTALELVFELKETEYNFESAEIVLLNVDDRSLITRPVTESSDSFTYEVDDDIIPHYGEWHGQLRFEAGETYVSSPVKFRIENDLSNDRPPQLSDVQSWVSLKRYADSLTEELKQAVLEVEGMDDTFNANELERQTIFETAESERDRTFESNETVRQAQELEREKAETTRQKVFDGNEAIRTETFNINEATRQANETARQQAELSRSSSEEQRKIDHANRSAELDGKADKVVLTNLVSNNEGWLGVYGSSSLSNEEIVYKTETLVSPSRIEYIPYNPIVGDTYYARFEIKPIFPNDTYIRIGGISGGEYNPIAEEWSSISSLIIAENNERIRFFHDVKSNYFVGDEIRFRNTNVINLTKTFGLGNEPSKEEMDELIKVTGYFNGEYALNNKEILIWTLALIRRNKNAIITLGGTI